MPTFRLGTALIALLVIVLLSGCGQKGPLYLPKPQLQSSEQTPSPRP